MLRVAVITSLAQRASAGVGRTALMKLAFILQILKDAPLSYSFRLYTYGPYDPQVLEDLKIAERLGGVSSQAFEWQGGMGYEIIPGAKAAEVIARAGKSLEELEEGLDWVVSEFAGQSASDLEIVSTIIYVDRAGEGTIKGASELLGSSPRYKAPPQRGKN